MSDESKETIPGSAAGTQQPGREPDSGETPELKVTDRRWWVRPEADAAPREAAAGEETTDRQWQPRKPSYVEELEQRLAEKDRLLQEYAGKYKDAAQEFENARARMRRDVRKEIDRGTRVVLGELLDVVDNMDRALEAGRAAASAEPLVRGIEMVREQFLAKLQGFGVTQIAALGEPFDPTRHEAASIVPTTNPAQDDHIVGVVRHGYEAGGELLRPALVAVARVLDES